MTNPPMTQVFSSAVEAIGYDAENAELHVQWSGGSQRRSIYSGVPLETADAVMTAWSVGQALHQMVKANYKHRYA